MTKSGLLKGTQAGGTKEPCPVLSAVECRRRVPTRIIRPPLGIIDRKPLDVRGKSEEKNSKN